MSIAGVAVVLVVDDDSGARNLARAILSRQGHTIVEAPGADAALEALRTNAVAVALVDRNMPEHDGFWLIERMQQEFPHVAIILSTADDAIPARLSLQPGVVGYLVKPIKRELLEQTVNDAVAWHHVASKRQRSPGI